MIYQRQRQPKDIPKTEALREDVKDDDSKDKDAKDKLDIFLMYLLVLEKFGLVRFEALFAKPETKPFGFSQIFRNQNQNQNRIKPFDAVSNGFKPSLNQNRLRKKLFVIIYLHYIIS